jgi:hypothetical protein
MFFFWSPLLGGLMDLCLFVSFTFSYVNSAASVSGTTVTQSLVKISATPSLFLMTMLGGTMTSLNRPAWASATIPLRPRSPVDPAWPATVHSVLLCTILVLRLPVVMAQLRMVPLQRVLWELAQVQLSKSTQGTFTVNIMMKMKILQTASLAPSRNLRSCITLRHTVLTLHMAVAPPALDIKRPPGNTKGSNRPVMFRVNTFLIRLVPMPDTVSQLQIPVHRLRLLRSLARIHPLPVTLLARTGTGE